jgi:hypothetical protein
MGSPLIDLFATSLNYKLEIFVSPIVNTVCREDREKRSEFPLDSEDKPPLSYCLWLSTETVFESLLGSVSMTIELTSFSEDLCVLLNDNLPKLHPVVLQAITLIWDRP